MSKIHRFQQQCKDDYGLDIDVHNLFKLWELVRELKTVLKCINKIGKDYHHYINKRYKPLKSNAEELGVTISEPLRNPSSIKGEIAVIFDRCGFDNKNHRVEMLKWMGLSDDVKNLPRPKEKITTEDDSSWWNESTAEMYSGMSAEEQRLHYEQEVDEMEQHETDLINYYNSQL